MQDLINSALQNPKQSLRVEVCGGIASGKTTFATLLKRIGIEPILESFQTNPFWEAFYADPASHAFETEIAFLLQHYHQVKIARTKENIFICDFSLLLDLAYAKVTLHGPKYKAFLSVYEEIKRDLGFPNLLVYLHCSADIELERIRRRGRITEESITLEYLGAINNSLEYRISEICQKTKVISINSEHQNFADDEIVKENMLNLILKFFAQYDKRKTGYVRLFTE